jgi:hypothetical protein
MRGRPCLTFLRTQRLTKACLPCTLLLLLLLLPLPPITVPKGVNNSRAGDMAKGGWAGAYSKFTPNENIKQGIVSAVACEFCATNNLTLLCNY